MLVLAAAAGAVALLGWWIVPLAYGALAVLIMDAPLGPRGR
ncbi:hypothetical protein BX604_2901 [Burkholderia sp. JKS000303]|nr:hypothetical protein BX604_2901 [Burkholderia sp. JKS000303]